MGAVGLQEGNAMIQLIGIIIGCYVTTRMVDMLSRPSLTSIQRTFAVLTLIITVVCTLTILTTGVAPSSAGAY